MRYRSAVAIFWEIAATPPKYKIEDGTPSKFVFIHLIKVCTKFHAFITKCTKFGKICSYPQDYNIANVRYYLTSLTPSNNSNNNNNYYYYNNNNNNDNKSENIRNAKRRCINWNWSCLKDFIFSIIQFKNIGHD